MPRSLIRSLARTLTTPLLLALALTGCNSDWSGSRDLAALTYRTEPAPGYKTDIIALMRTYLNDPAGVRDACLKPPHCGRLKMPSVTRSVCATPPTRGGTGQYAGQQGHGMLVIFREGRVDHIVDTVREMCKDAAYQPFPELERLTR